MIFYSLYFAKMIYRPYQSPQAQTIGPFEYFQTQVVGKGSSSTAYVGRKIATNQKVCIKQIVTRNQMSLEFAKMEIEVLKRISHENVLKYLTHLERGSSVYIVTQLCQTTLLDDLRKDKKRDHLTVLKTFLQILQGYQALRNMGYIHRDLKPDNILIKDGKIKLADFGYCALLKKDQIQGQVNLGTPIYMAPEALLKSIYSQQSDIWSLGVTLFQMLTGKVPFTSNQQSTLKIQLAQPVRKLDVGLPSLNNIINGCLFYNPSARYQLQSLLLAVKLVINELQESQKERDKLQNLGRNRFICMNEFNYIKFLEYIKYLCKNAKITSPELRDSLLYLFQFKIRMRISCLTSFFEEMRAQNGNFSQKILSDYRILKQEHKFDLEYPSRVNSSSRLNFFHQELPVFKKSLHWQSQAVLKEIISSLFAQLVIPQSELAIARSEANLKLVDYLITAFILNKILIQNDNNMEDFAKRSHLGIILSSPSRINGDTWRKIMKKAIKMNMI